VPGGHHRVDRITVISSGGVLASHVGWRDQPPSEEAIMHRNRDAEASF
jgi:hypothetical protein